MMKKIILLLAVCCPLIASAQSITRMEYWIDRDPGFGNGFAIENFPVQSNITDFHFELLPIASGAHTVGFRAKDGDGVWSHTNFVQILVLEPAVTSDLINAEFFWDADPGFGNGDPYTFTIIAESQENVTFTIDVPNLSLGSHYLFSRSKDSRNKYSHTNLYDVLLATADFSISGIKIYPNPVENELNVDLADSGKSRLVVYDMNGKRMLDTVVETNAKIDMTSFSAGMYTAYFWKEQNKIYVAKLIKK